MNMDVNKIFDVAMKVSDEIDRVDKIEKKQQQIQSVESKRCGNCDLWMKSTCRPEKEFKQFKSCNSFACKDFKRDSISKELITRFKKELKILNETYYKHKKIELEKNL